MLFANLLVAYICFGSQVISNLPIGRENSGKPIPKFANGFTIFYDRESQIIESYDSTGASRTRVTLSLPESERVVITDVTANKAGRLAVAGSAISHGGQIAFVLLWIREDGILERIVRLNPFVSRRIRFTDDGHLWALGTTRDSANRDTPEHDMLHEYSEAGDLIKTMFPRSTFEGVHHHPTDSAFLVTHGDSVGIYSETAGAYAEYRSSGQFVGKWDIPSISDVATPTGAGRTASGDLFVGGFDNSTSSAITYRFHLASGASSKSHIPPQTDPLRIGTLLAVEGDALIYYGKPTGIVRVSVN